MLIYLLVGIIAIFVCITLSVIIGTRYSLPVIAKSEKLSTTVNEKTYRRHITDREIELLEANEKENYIRSVIVIICNVFAVILISLFGGYFGNKLEILFVIPAVFVIGIILCVLSFYKNKILEKEQYIYTIGFLEKQLEVSSEKSKYVLVVAYYDYNKNKYYRTKLEVNESYEEKLFGKIFIILKDTGGRLKPLMVSEE